MFSFDALVCNPPFFSSLASAGVNPARSAAATANELVCPGGEEQFVAQIIRESKQRQGQIRYVPAAVAVVAILTPPASGVVL